MLPLVISEGYDDPAQKWKVRTVIRRWIASLGLAVALAAGLLAMPASAAELVMFTSKSCIFCARFEAEVGRTYSKTDEGRIAPLRRVDIADRHPADLAAIPPERLTPTFVLIADGREIGRIRGYAGEAFFFGQLQRLLQELQSTRPARL
jgi:thioredoxin-related protein